MRNWVRDAMTSLSRSRAVEVDLKRRALLGFAFAAVSFGELQASSGASTMFRYLGPPILNNVTISMGQYTQSTRGCVRLNSLALGLLQAGTPTDWNVGAASVNPTYWGVAGAVVEGPLARTPSPTATGVSNGISGGPFNFTISASNFFGSASCTLTITRYAGAASLGDPFTTDNFPGAVVGVATTYAGTKVILTTGANRGLGGIQFSGFAFPSTVTVEYADPSRPSIISQASITNSSTNITLTGLILDGPLSSGVSARVYFNNSDNCKILNSQIGAEGSIMYSGIYAIRMFPGCDGTEIGNITILNQYNGIDMADATNSNVHDINIRYFAGNAIQYGSVNGLTVSDFCALQPVIIPGDAIHPDLAQCNDGSTPVNVLWNRMEFYAGYATNGAQGIWTGGHSGATSMQLMSVNGLAYVGWSINALAWITNVGASYGKNITLVKANTGDPSQTQPGGGFAPEGPNIFGSATVSGDWTPNVTITSAYVMDEIDTFGVAAFTIGSGVIQRARTIQANDFKNGNPKTALEAINGRTLQSMGFNQLRDTYRQALVPGSNLNDGQWIGAFTDPWAWNTRV